MAMLVITNFDNLSAHSFTAFLSPGLTLFSTELVQSWPGYGGARLKRPGDSQTEVELYL